MAADLARMMKNKARFMVAGSHYSVRDRRKKITGDVKYSRILVSP